MTDLSQIHERLDTLVNIQKEIEQHQRESTRQAFITNLLLATIIAKDLPNVKNPGEEAIKIVGNLMKQPVPKE